MTSLLPGLILLVLSCRSEPKDGEGEIGADTGASDGGASDGGASDGGASDGGATDGGASDGGASDGGADTGDTGTGGWDTGADGGSSDGGSSDGGVPETTAWCLDFEDGTLDAVGYSGSFVEREDGGLVFIADEGDNWSALIGEEALDLRDDRALVLRSSHDGDVSSQGVATTDVFTVEETQLSFWQLSEVDERGVSLTADLLDEDSDTVLGSVALPVLTGGFVPELEDFHDPISGFPEITTDGGAPGELQRVVIDVSEWVGSSVRLQLRQNTVVELNGFFTVIDDLCHGSGADPDAVVVGPTLKAAPTLR